MEAVDNFDLIQKYIDKECITANSDAFYFVQVLMRKGTNISDSNSNRARTLKTYYITTTKRLEDYKEEIIYYCEKTKCRAYINLNARSYRESSLQNIALLAQSIKNGHDNSAHTIYNKALMDTPIKGPKTWIIDFDNKDYDNHIDVILAASDFKDYYDEISLDSTFQTIPSKNGFHVLCRPFRKDTFANKMTELGIKCELKLDASTNLYIPSDN